MTWMKTLTTAGALALFVAGGAVAQEVRTLGPGARPQPAAIEDLKGIVGMWAGEHYSAAFSEPAVGEMVGHVQVHADGAPRLQELWVFRAENGGVTARLKLFDAQLKGLQDKDSWMERRLLAHDETHLYFEHMTLTTAANTLELVAEVGTPTAPRTVTLHYRRVR